MALLGKKAEKEEKEKELISQKGLLKNEIREILTSKGIVLEDTRGGVKWKRM